MVGNLSADPIIKWRGQSPSASGECASDPEIFFFAWGGRDKSGHPFGPIGFSPGRPLPWDWGWNVIKTPKVMFKGPKLILAVAPSILIGIQQNLDMLLRLKSCNFEPFIWFFGCYSFFREIMENVVFSGVRLFHNCEWSREYFWEIPFPGLRLWYFEPSNQILRGYYWDFSIGANSYNFPAFQWKTRF